MTANIRTGKRPFARSLGAMLVSGQLVVVLSLLLSNVGAVQAQTPAGDPTGTETPSADATATEAPPTEPSAADTSVTVTPTPESGAPMFGVPAVESAITFHKVSPANLATVVETSQFQLKWSDAGIDVTTPGGDSYSYCIDEIDDDTCNTSWVQKRNLQTAAGDVVVVVWHTYFWQVRTEYAGVYADCPSCWWSFTVIPSPTKTISGVTGLPGTHVGYAGTTTGTVTAGAGGMYSITVANHWSGTVTPSLSGYSFSPASRVYVDVMADQINQDYTPGVAVLYTISGDADLDGVTISFAGASASGFAFSVLGGGYSFAVPSGWSGTVTPSKLDYVFSPVNRSYIGVIANQVNQDYSPTPQESSILRLFPAPSSTDCLKPKVGVSLQLSALMLDGSGLFDPSTVTLMLDGVVRTSQAMISDAGTFPASKALILYTPPANLSAGSHWVTFVYPSSGGPVTTIWYFNVSSTTCNTSAPLEAPAPAPQSDAARAEESSEAAADSPESAAAEPDEGSLAPIVTATAPAPVTPEEGQAMPHPGLFGMLMDSTH